MIMLFQKHIQNETKDCIWRTHCGFDFQEMLQWEIRDKEEHDAIMARQTPAPTPAAPTPAEPVDEIELLTGRELRRHLNFFLLL